jgi:putative transcription antitermination factor YqgF
MKYLGVDYGKRKIGLSISEGLTATPLKVIKVKGLEDAISKISSVIRSEKADEMIIGVPESGEARSVVKKFIERICKIIRVVEADETLTTIDAISLIKELKKNKKMEDAYAATLILQNYLDILNGEA